MRYRTTAPGRRRRLARGDAGFATTQFVAATGLSFLLVLMVANLVAYQYGRGAVRAALDEGVRAGSRATSSTAECQQRAQSALDDLLGGPMGQQVRIVCAAGAEAVTATADVAFQGWLPAVPDWSFRLSAYATKERPPQ